MASFDIYTKAVEQVFELDYRLTLKIEVLFNETRKRKIGEEIKENFHNEFIIGGSNITTNLKYRYRLVLSPKGDRENILYIDWDNYDDLFMAIERSIAICDPDNPNTPFQRIIDDTGEIIDIRCDSLKVKYQKVMDRWKNTLDMIPFVLIDNSTGNTTEAIRFRFSADSCYDIPISRIRGLRRFLMTYNPVLHAGAIARYMASTPLLGSNRTSMVR